MMNQQSPFSVVVGVDVSKAKLDFAFADGQETFSIDNTPPKIVAEPIGRIKNPKATIVVMEATGGYEELLVTLLHQHDIAVAVVNARRVRDFAKGIGKDAKTDTIDANVIAFYGQVAQPAAQVAKSDEQRFRKNFRPASDVWWSLVCPSRALYGHFGGHAIQYPHQSLLSAFAGRRETQESGPDRGHAKAAHDLEHAPQDQSTLGGTPHREPLSPSRTGSTRALNLRSEVVSPQSVTASVSRGHQHLRRQTTA